MNDAERGSVNPAETARKALEILDRDGWCKGSIKLNKKSRFQIVLMGDAGNQFIPSDSSPYRDGSCCLGGAWNVALHGEPNFLRGCSEVYEPLISVILSEYPEIEDMQLDRTSVILHFNDRRATSEDDVRAILEKIAAC